MSDDGDSSGMGQAERVALVRNSGIPVTSAGAEHDKNAAKKEAGQPFTHSEHLF
jgi:hypothetical protein